MFRGLGLGPGLGTQVEGPVVGYGMLSPFSAIQNRDYSMVGV